MNSAFRRLPLVLMTFSGLLLQAGDIPVKTGDANLKVKQNTYSELQLSSSFTTFTYNEVITEKGTFINLTIPDYGTSNRLGHPQLPMLRKLIEIPVGASVSIKVNNYTVTEYRLSDYGIVDKLIPSQLPVSKNPDKKLPDFQYNRAIYSSDRFNTDSLVTVDILGVMRGVRLARLNIAPVRYNPVSNTIKVYNDIEVEITFPGADVVRTIQLRKNFSSLYFESMYNKQLLNYKSVQAKDTISKYPVKYVIVSDSAFQTALQPFIQWKVKKGFIVVEAYTNNPAVGKTTSSIKNYLQNLYDTVTPSDPAPSFVLLVGDIAQVPSFAGTTASHVTDLYYCEYTGDELPEVYYGRFSATNVSELQPQIDKTLEYEQYAMPDPSFLNEVVMVAGQDISHGHLYGDGQVNYGTSTYFNSAHGLTSHIYPYAVSGDSAAQIIRDVSNGVCYANYTAHGDYNKWSDPEFNISDIPALQNNHKYPLMVGNSCLTNKFDEPVCFGEALLRANGKGALGYIGGSNETYWDEDYWWSVGYKTVVLHPAYNTNSLGAYDRTFHDHGESFDEWYASQGQMIFAGNLAVTQSGSSDTKYYWEIYHLMGDPSLMVYFGVPSALTATYSPLIPIGATTFTVNTEPYSYVAVSMDSMLYGAALSDSSGVADVFITAFTTEGTADIVVTKQNKSPFFGTAIVASPIGPYIVYNNIILHDNAGNNNGKADYGEPITFDIALQNVGSVTADSVSVKLRTNDIYITITDSSQKWGNIAKGAIVSQDNAFAFAVNNFIPDQHVVLFSLVITDRNDSTWTTTFRVTLNAPVLTIGNITVSDLTGNNNSRLDPGETDNLTITFFNKGHANADSLIGTLISTMDSIITINTGPADIGILNAGSSVEATFNVTVSPSVAEGSLVDFTVALTNGLYSVQKNISKMVGVISENWETGTFTKFSWIQNDHPWTITETTPYEGIYCAKSGKISDNDTSTLSVAFNVLTDDSISFYKKVSSEANYDFLIFFIDDSQKDSWCDTTESWSRAVFPVTAGNHTFKWSYKKDNSESAGSDCAWIDYISFPPIQAISSLIEEQFDFGNTLNCYPNPFHNSAVITYGVTKTERVSMLVYNSIGQKAATLVNGENKMQGYHSITFNAGSLPPGIYHCVLLTDNKSIVRKMIIH